MDSTPRSAALSRQDLEAILSITRSLAAPFDLQHLLAEIASSACRLLDAQRCSVWLHDVAAGEMVLTVASDLDNVRVAVGSGLVGACARDRALINVPDCYADPRFDAAVDRRSGFVTRCSLTLPLVDHQDALVGVMQVLNKDGAVFAAGDEELGLALAAQCAVGLTRVRMTESLVVAEKLRHEVELARAVQLSTLPASLPQVPGYDMHATFLPASLTGGDTYDAALVDQGLLLVIGDATGHGIAPALSVTQMQAMLRMALALGADLETAFTRVNDRLAAVLPDGRFVTAFIGLLDAAKHRLRFLSGGQGPILHFHASERRCQTHKATSFPMGAMRIAALRPPVEIDLAPGDWLLLLTDGVFETEAADGEQFGVARVEALLAAHHGETPAALASRLLADLKRFAGDAAQEDDITMLMVKRAPG